MSCFTITPVDCLMSDSRGGGGAIGRIRSSLVCKRYGKIIRLLKIPYDVRSNGGIHLLSGLCTVPMGNGNCTCMDFYRA